jgi:WD40 repeat protein
MVCLGLAAVAGLLLPARSLAQGIKKQATLEVDGGRLVTVLAFSPDGKLLVGGEDQPGLAGMLWVWDVAKGRKLVSFKGHQGRVQAIAISPDGKTVASGDRSGEIKVFEAATGKEKITLKPRFGGEMFLALKFSADGTTLTSASQISVTNWDLGTGKDKDSFSLGSAGEEDENQYDVATISADGMPMVASLA